MSRRFLILLLLFPLSLIAQTPARWDAPPLSTIVNNPAPGSFPPMLAIPNAAVQFCGFPAVGNPCTNLITTYTDSTLATSCLTSSQIVYNGIPGCVSRTDSQGNFGIWYNIAANPHITWTAQTSYGKFGPFDILPGSSGGSGGGSPSPPNFAVQISNAGQTAFAADANILENTSTHTLTSPRYGHLPTITIPDDTGASTSVGCTAAVVGDGVTDDYAALQACVNANPTVHLLFRKTQAPGSCDYFFSQPLQVNGSDSFWEGVTGGVGRGVLFCYATDVSGIWFGNSKAQQVQIAHLNFKGNNPWTNAVLADFVVPQMFGGTGSNAPGIIANGNAPVINDVRVFNFANSGLDVMSSDSLGAPISTANWSGGTATVVTTVGHGCATGMAAQVTGVTGLTGSSTTTKVVMTFVNSTTVTFPASGSGSFSGTGGALLCNDWQSGLGLYGIADKGTVTSSYFSNNRGDGTFTMGGDSNVWEFINNANLSNQLAGVRETSFLGNTYTTIHTDANGWDLTTPGTQTSMSSVSVTNNILTFTTSDPALIQNSATAPYQGSQIQVTGCSIAGPAAITRAQIILAFGIYYLQVAVTGALGGSGNITTSGLSLSGSLGGFNPNGTFSNALFITNAANSGNPGWEIPITGYTGSVTTDQAQTGTATNYPSQANANWWITSTAGGGVWSARSNPTRATANFTAGTVSGCNEAIFPGTQVWATANIDGGAGIYAGVASGNTIVAPYTESDQRSIKCAQYDRFINGDVGSGYDPQYCTGHYETAGSLTQQKFYTPDANGVQQGTLTSVGGGLSPYDGWQVQERSCNIGSFANSCGISFTHSQPSIYLTGEDWWGFNGGPYASNIISTPGQYSLLLGNSQTTENLTGTNPPIWVTNGMNIGFTGVHPKLTLTWGSAAPTSGTYTVGSIVWNTNPISNGIAEWVNTVAGTPGTWQPVYYGTGGAGVVSINSVAGSFTFSGAGVSCTSTTCTFSGTGSGVSSLTGDGTLITNSASTGVVTLTLGSPAAHTVFGNFTGSAATPTFTAAPTFSAANLTNFPTFNQNTTGTAANLTGCTPSTAGSLCYWNGSAWTLLAGNTTATNFLQETSAGVPSWATAGTVTSIATTSPITGGTITSTGTIACATCVTSAASLTSGDFMLGQGSQASASTTHLDDGVTTASTITSSENISAPKGIFTGAGIPISQGTTSNTDLAGQLTLSSGTASYTFAATHTAASFCVATDTTAANAVKVVVTTTTLTITGTGSDVVNYICIGTTP